MKAARPYQEKAIRRCCELLRSGASTLLVAPTGSGKSFIGGSIAREIVDEGGGALLLAHRRELVSQLSGTLSSFGIDHGVIASGVQPMPHMAVQVASIQTLVARPKAIPDREKLKIVVIDEAHRAPADTYAQIMDKVPDSVPVLGLTATPWRSDDAQLSEVFDELVVATSVMECVDAGYLVAPSVKRPGEFDWAKNSMMGDPVTHWEKFAKGMRTVVFAASVAESKRYAEAFSLAGIRAVHLDGNTPAQQRQAALDGIAAEEPSPLVICNYDLLTEGWDLPSLQCVVMARKTESTIVYRQAIGRVMRPPGPAVVLDLAGCTVRHGYVTEEPEYALDDDMPGVEKRPRSDLRVCKLCLEVTPVGAACVSCGQKAPAIPRASLDWVAGELVDAAASPLIGCLSNRAASSRYGTCQGLAVPDCAD